MYESADIDREASSTRNLGGVSYSLSKKSLFQKAAAVAPVIEESIAVHIEASSVVGFGDEVFQTPSAMHNNYR